MMKLTNLLKSRGILSMNNGCKDVLGSQNVMGAAGFSTFGQKGSNDERVFAAYNVFKGKAALSAEPVAPTFGKVEAGGVFVKRQGYIMLSFSPSKGERKYDWERKQKFALSATEVGALLTLSPSGSCEFFHDPGMKTSNAGQVRKTLSVKANGDGNGYFVSLSVNDSIKKVNDRLTVPVTAAEFAVMRTSFSFALPHIMGWDKYSSQSPAAKREYSPNVGQYSSQSPAVKREYPPKIGQQSFDSEWDR